MRQFVELAKYPPIGRRGVSSTTAGAGYTLGVDPQKTLSQANEATHLMVLIESDEGYAALDAILEIEGVDMITVGQQDWGASLESLASWRRDSCAQRLKNSLSGRPQRERLYPSALPVLKMPDTIITWALAYLCWGWTSLLSVAL